MTGEPVAERLEPRERYEFEIFDASPAPAPAPAGGRGRRGRGDRQAPQRVGAAPCGAVDGGLPDRGPPRAAAGP